MISVKNAVTLENIIKYLLDKFKPELIDDRGEEEEIQKLKDSDIASKNIYLSLGIFGFLFGLLFFALLVYFGLLCLLKRIKCCTAFVNNLKRKLFFNVWIRFMIESNLKMTHNCIFFVYISGGFNKTINAV